MRPHAERGDENVGKGLDDPLPSPESRLSSRSKPKYDRRLYSGISCAVFVDLPDIQACQRHNPDFA